MFKLILFGELLLVHYATQNPTKVEKDCSEDISLECPVADYNFLSVAWYKTINNTKHGIIRKGNGEDPVYYGFRRDARFGEKHSLFLQSVSPEDSGRYECTISANVGSQNRNHIVNLHVRECVTQAEPTTVRSVLNTTHSCQTQIQNLPVSWSIAGYVAVAVAKIVFTLISIWIMRISCSRQQYNRWYS